MSFQMLTTRPTILAIYLIKHFVATAFVALVAITICRAAQPASGRWEGSVQIPDRQLTLIIDLAPGENGKWSGSLIVPGLNLKGKQLDDVAVRGSEVSFAFATGRGLQATLKGKISGDLLTGDFSEAGNTARFVLRKSGPAQVEAPARSTAVSNEFEGEWKGQFELYGYPRTVTIKLTNHGNDGATAEFVVVGRKTTIVPVDLIKQEEKFLTVDSHDTGITYEGAFNPETREIKGAFIQGALEIPLVLQHPK
jgi:hypothetical protein